MTSKKTTTASSKGQSNMTNTSNTMSYTELCKQYREDPPDPCHFQHREEICGLDEGTERLLMRVLKHGSAEFPIGCWDYWATRIESALGVLVEQWEILCLNEGFAADRIPPLQVGTFPNGNFTLVLGGTVDPDGNVVPWLKPVQSLVKQ
jgi:hypothetical protein